MLSFFKLGPTSKTPLYQHIVGTVITAIENESV